MTKQNNNSTRRRRPYANEAPYCRRFGDGLTQKKKRNKNRFQPAHLHSDRQITTFLLETGIKIVSSLVLFCFFLGQKKEKPDLESSPANGLRFQIGGFVNKRERERESNEFSTLIGAAGKPVGAAKETPKTAPGVGRREEEREQEEEEEEEEKKERSGATP